MSEKGIPFYPFGRGDLGRTPTFYRTDLLIQHDSGCSSGHRINVGLNIENLFDHDTVTRNFPPRTATPSTSPIRRSSAARSIRWRSRQRRRRPIARIRATCRPTSGSSGARCGCRFATASKPRPPRAGSSPGGRIAAAFDAEIARGTVECTRHVAKSDPRGGAGLGCPSRCKASHKPPRVAHLRRRSRQHALLRRSTRSTPPTSASSKSPGGSRPTASGPRPEFKFESTPLMVNGRLFSTAGTRRAVVALDAATGELLWMHSEHEGARGAGGAAAAVRPRPGVLDRRQAGANSLRDPRLSAGRARREHRPSGRRLSARTASSI